MRLTEKSNQGYIYKTPCPDGVGFVIYDEQPIQQLGRYEDIEDELGIDLITLFKALDHFYFKDNDGKIYHVPKHNVEYSLVHNQKEWLIQLRWCEGHYNQYDYHNGSHIEKRLYLVTDYGKTWALTKEELL